MKNISEIGYAYARDIYVIGSGKSLDFINKEFFNNKVTIGLNYAHLYFPCVYSVSHHFEHCQDMIDQGCITVVSEYKMAMTALEKHNTWLHGDYFWYKHKEQGFGVMDLGDFDNPEALACGGTIAVTGIHLAQRLGARSIILCGIDGGTIDGKMNYSGYNDPTNVGHTIAVQPIIDQVCNKIRESGVGVYSLNPFTNFRLEGHTFSI